MVTGGTMKKNKKRNWLAVRAHLRQGAGAHVDKKKKQNKLACRGQAKGGEQ